MLRTLLAISTGGLCTFGLWAQQEVQDEKQITVELRSNDAGDPAKLLREMKELRVQLVSVLGANHPAVRTVDTQIRQMSGEGSLAENVFAPIVVPGNAADALSVSPGAAWAWSSEADGAFPAPFMFDADGATADVNSVRRVFRASPSVNSANFNLTNATNGAAPNSEFRAKLASLRAKWTSAESEDSKKTVLDELKATIETQFDTDLQKRKQQVDSLEKKLEELKKQVQKRESLRDKFVQNLTEHTEMEWEGVSLQSERPTVFGVPLPRPMPPGVPEVAAPDAPPATNSSPEGSR